MFGRKRQIIAALEADLEAVRQELRAVTAQLCAAREDRDSWKRAANKYGQTIRAIRKIAYDPPAPCEEVLG